MRDRLIELLQNFADGTYTSNGTITDGTKVDDVVDYLIANGVIVPPCEFGDTIYVIPSKTNIALNIVNGFSHLNRVYKQKIDQIRIFANNKYLLSTCDGLQSVHCDMYKETWFLTREEAEKALKGGAEE